MTKSPKIVILDGYAANPGDLSWEEMEKLGDLTVYPHVPANEEELLEKSKEVFVIKFLNKKIPLFSYQKYKQFFFNLKERNK